MLLALLLVMLAIPAALTLQVQQEQSVSAYRPVDLGVAFIWIVFLYAFLPVTGIMLAESGWGELPDLRLNGSVPDRHLVVAVATSYAAFMFAFALAYSRFHIWRPARNVPPPRPTAPDLRLAVILAVAIKAGLFLIAPVAGVSAAQDYISSYLTFRDQPLLVQQVAGVLTSLDFAATILLIVTAVAHSRVARLVIAVLVIAQIALAISAGGSRSYAFLCAFAFLVARSIYDPRLRFGRMVMYCAFGVAAFLVAGLIRSGLEEGESVLTLRLLQDGEFVSVFINSLDLLDRAGDVDVAALLPRIYFVDVLRFIPQQIVGSLKVDPASYYVTTFHPGYGEAGGGLAFGSIAEATVGFGWIEAFVRGGLLGCLYAFITKQCLRGKLSVLRAFAYVWFVVVSYQAIRDTTFSVLARFVMHVVPLLIFVKVGSTFYWQKKPNDGKPRESATLIKAGT